MWQTWDSSWCESPYLDILVALMVHKNNSRILANNVGKQGKEGHREKWSVSSSATFMNKSAWPTLWEHLWRLRKILIHSQWKQFFQHLTSSIFLRLLLLLLLLRLRLRLLLNLWEKENKDKDHVRCVYNSTVTILLYVSDLMCLVHIKDPCWLYSVFKRWTCLVNKPTQGWPAVKRTLVCWLFWHQQKQ